MKFNDTALILIGYQNDYFAPDGVLHSSLECQERIDSVLETTVRLLEKLGPTDLPMVATPIAFTPNYEELVEPVGILKTIRDVGAFRAGGKGSNTIPELRNAGDRIDYIVGKRGLNAFAETGLDSFLRQRAVRNVVLAGVVTSLCIDSTGRSAHERGYRVTILQDATSGRTEFEQQYYCEQIFPLYANVTTAGELLREVGC